MRKNKIKKQLPSTEEFLTYHPMRCSFEWYIDDENRVNIKVPKFQKEIGKKFCRLIKKNDMFTARLDDIGSFIWQQCDGNKTVNDILIKLEDNFPNQENIDKRLFLFLQQMQQLHYIQLLCESR